MLPLAQYLAARGVKVAGSDRAFDQERSPEKFSLIKKSGIELFPQDGSGVTTRNIMVVSSAVESHIPDVAAAQKLGIPIIKRAELLAQIFNNFPNRVAVAGTSGKSTVTAMIGFILQCLGARPTIINGAVMVDFITDENPYAAYVVGDDHYIVIEADESDGSIELYDPTIAVLNNIALDHKPMGELRSLFKNYLQRAEKGIVNVENREARDVAQDLENISYISKQEYQNLQLHVIGAHNFMNARMAVAAVKSLGFDEEKIISALRDFRGVKRRLEKVGEAKNVIVIDDFAHNPDKIAASLNALKETPGRLLILFQMHGFAPLKLMFDELKDSFVKGLGEGDKIYIPEVLYLGGTTTRDVTAHDFVRALQGENIDAAWFEKRDEIIPQILSEAKAGDRIIIMGARDDTLSDVARLILKSLDGK